jgi:hypothetical protein
MVGLHAALACNGMQTMDLWGAGSIRPLTPKAMQMVPVAAVFSYVCFYAGALTVVYALGLLMVAFARKDHLAVLLSMVFGACAALSAFLAFGVGLVLAGV